MILVKSLLPDSLGQEESHLIGVSGLSAVLSSQPTWPTNCLWPRIHEHPTRAQSFRRPEKQLSFSPAPTSKGSPTPVNPASKLGTHSPFSNLINTPQVLSEIRTNNFSNANLIRSLYCSCPSMASHCSEESRQFPSTACKALGHSSSLG